MRYKAQRLGDTCERVAIALFSGLSRQRCQDLARQASSGGPGSTWIFRPPAYWRERGYGDPEYLGVVEVQEEYRRVVPPNATRQWRVVRRRRPGDVVTLLVRTADCGVLEYHYREVPELRTIRQDLRYAGWNPLEVAGRRREIIDAIAHELDRR